MINHHKDAADERETDLISRVKLKWLMSNVSAKENILVDSY